MTDMVFDDEENHHKDTKKSQICNSEKDVKKVMGAITSFTNPFNNNGNNNQLYCLSSGLPASADIANDLLGAFETGKSSMNTFIEERLVKKKSHSMTLSEELNSRHLIWQKSQRN
jgi:hypothetical protein